jgi:hypothetical protein
MQRDLSVENQIKKIKQNHQEFHLSESFETNMKDSIFVDFTGVGLCGQDYAFSGPENGQSVLTSLNYSEVNTNNKPFRGTESYLH